MMTSKQIVKGFVAGAAIGAVVGLLFAPKSGSETRQLLGNKTQGVRSKAGGYITSLKNRGRQVEEVESLNGAV